MHILKVSLGILLLLYSAPTAKGLYCIPDLIAPDHGWFNCTDGNLFNSVCTFQCESTDYRLVGHEDLVCFDDADETVLGVWTSTEPVCEWTGLKDVCTENNGGCYDQCIGGTTPVTCGCPCGQTLNADSMQCDATNACDVDILLLIDYSDKTDPTDCNSSGTTYAAWQEWRTKVVGIMEELSTAYPSAYFAVQSYANGIVRTFQTFTAQQGLSVPKAVISGTTEPDCGSLTSFTSLLSGASLPSGKRSSASKFAYVISAGTSTDLDDAAITVNMENALQEFDDVVIITDFTENADVEAARFAACGNKTESCENVFSLEGLNDLSAAPSSSNFVTVADPDMCIERDETNGVEVTSCVGSVQARIEQCALRGLPLTALQANDPSCTVGDFMSTDSSNYYSFDMPYGSCDMTETFDESAGTLTYTQTLITDPAADADSFPDVEIDISCVIPAYSPDNIFMQSLRPQAVVLSSDQNSDGGTYSLDVQFFSDAAFTQLLQPGSSTVEVTVNDTLYGEASSSDMLSDSRLQLHEIKATPTDDINDATSWLLVENGCPKDTTFASLPDGTSGSTASDRFQFQMFQFSATARTLANKLPVYLHLSYYICLTTDTSPRCSPSCSGRRRRSVDDEGTQPTITNAVGPFLVIQNSTSTREDDDALAQRVKPTYSWPHKLHLFAVRDRLSQIGKGFSLHTNLLLIFVVIIVVYSTTKSKHTAIDDHISVEANQQHAACSCHHVSLEACSKFTNHCTGAIQYLEDTTKRDDPPAYSQELIHF